MTEKLGEAVLELRTDQKGLDSGIKSAKSKAKGMAKDLAKIGAGIALAIGAAFVATASAALKANDEFAKMSRSIGVSVESLSGLKVAAELSGTTFGSMTNALKRLSANAFDTSMGVGEAKIAFEQLGVSVTDSSGNLRDSDEIMLDVADRFSEMEDGTTKTALAMDIFGKSGTELIPMLNAGAEGITAMTDEAAALGLVISTDTAEQSEKFNDAILKLSGTVTGFVNVILEAGLLDGLVIFAEALAEIGVESDKSGGIFKTLARILVSPIGLFFKMQEVVNGLIESFLRFTATALKIVQTMDRVMGSMSPFKSILGGPDGIQRRIDKTSLAMHQAKDRADKWRDKQRRLNEALDGTKQPLDDVKRKTDAVKKSFGGVQKVLAGPGGLSAALREHKKETDASKKAIQELVVELPISGFAFNSHSGVVEAGTKAATDYTIAHANIAQGFSDQGVIMLDFSKHWSDPDGGLTKLMDDGTEAANKSRAQFNELGSAMTTLAEGAAGTGEGSLSRSFETFSGSVRGSLDEVLNGVIGPGEFVQKMKDAFTNLGVNLLKTMADTFLDPLLDALDNLIKGVISKVVSGLFGDEEGGGGIGGAISGSGGITMPSASFTELAITGVAIQTGIFATGVQITSVQIQSGVFHTGVQLTGISFGFGRGGIPAGLDTNVARIQQELEFNLRPKFASIDGLMFNVDARLLIIEGLTRREMVPALWHAARNSTHTFSTLRDILTVNVDGLSILWQAAKTSIDMNESLWDIRSLNASMANSLIAIENKDLNVNVTVNPNITVVAPPSIAPPPRSAPNQVIGKDIKYIAQFQSDVRDNVGGIRSTIQGLVRRHPGA